MDNLLFGLQTAAIGMGIVFVVLALLWCLLTIVMKLDQGSARAAAAAAGGADAGPPEPAPGAGLASPGGAGSAVVRLVGAPDGLDPRLIAAITIAILRHEETRRLQAAPAMRSYWPGSLLFASRWVAAGRTRQGQSWRRRR
jgi:Na+-transporting methylmalonyl-CoA/oxaloacetate decarboxylase gamma subunit